MGITIGDINIPFVSGFSVDKADKPIEVIKHLGNIPPHVAEFQADVLKATISGTLFQASGDVRDVDQYAEDLDTLVDRFGVYNYINDYQSRSGWLILSTGDSDKSADSVLIRKYSLSGRFMPKNKYQTRMHTAPAILTNDFSLTLGAGGCDNYVPIPIGATYSGGDGSTITRVGKDGTTTLVKATTNKDIKWNLAADEVDVGECKVWDSVVGGDTTEANWVRVFNPDHVFTGDKIYENGLIRLKDLLAQTDFEYAMQAYVYANSTWQEISTRAGARENNKHSFVIEQITADEIHIKYITKGHTGSTTDLNQWDIHIFRGYQLYKIIQTNLSSSATINHPTYYRNESIIYTANQHVKNSFLSESESGTVTAQNWMFGIRETGDKHWMYIAALVDSEDWTFGNFASVLPYGTSLASGGVRTYFMGAAAPFTCSNLFKECEDMTQGAGVAFYTGVDASPKTGNTGSILDAQNENIYYEFTGGTDLPLGTYKLFMRAKDSAQVADDISCLVRNTTDSTDVMAETTKTLTGAWAYYSFDVTIASDDDTDTIRVTLNKETATANTIDLDYVLWIPITLDSGNGPQDIAHQAMVDQNLTRELIAR